MQDYRFETTVERDGSFTNKALPFPAGDRVEVIIRSQEPGNRKDNRYPLRGKPIRHTDPFEGVAEGDWEASR